MIELHLFVLRQCRHAQKVLKCTANQMCACQLAKYNLINCAKMQFETQQNERVFTDFLSRQPTLDQRTIRIDIDQFRQSHPQAAQEVIKNPAKYYKMAKNLLERGIQGDQKPRFEAKLEHYRISFEGNLGANFVTPRGLGSKLANELVGIQGIITKMEIPKHQLEKSVHYCEKTKAFEVKEYPDNLNPEKDFEPSKTRFIKTHDDNSNPLSFEYGMSSFRNIQTVVIQELPEMAPPGLLPQSVTVVLQGELVNSVKPGDRVQMIGIYKLIGGAMSKEKGIFRPYFLCLSVKQLSEVLHTGVFTNRNVIPEADLIGICSRSVAPSIYGHDELKKAVLLMLLGGEEKNLDNGTHLRGDINLLMVGDPGTAKSQILRWVLSTAELAIGTTGSGASGVGLTAAIVSDKDTGEKTLEAGAMVLADRGVVCIDEFDKMNEVDRVAVHEVMEQQTVTIAKAGMHCSLNARCSVIAAANPIYGEYQTTMAPTKNIGMPDSLLSRFDLVFIILDEKSPEKDKRIGERVCRNHRLAPKVAESYHTFNEDDEYIIHPNETQQSGRGDQVYQKNNIYQSDSKAKEILTQSYLRRYIAYCKANIHPQLTDDAVDLLAHLWALLRQADLNQRSVTHNRVLPITIRSYETLIRLSTAHAKLHQYAEVKIKDCVEAFRLMIYCLEGDSHAMDDKLKEILIKLELYDPAYFPSDKDDTHRPHRKNKKDKDHDKKDHEKKDHEKRDHERRDQEKKDQEKKDHEKKLAEKKAALQRKMDEESAHGITHKMARIDIHKDEREAERVIQQAVAATVPEPQAKPETGQAEKKLSPSQFVKEQKAVVYRALNASRNRKRNEFEGISYGDMLLELPEWFVEMYTEETIRAMLKEMDRQSQIHYDQTAERFYP